MTNLTESPNQESVCFSAAAAVPSQPLCHQKNHFLCLLGNIFLSEVRGLSFQNPSAVRWLFPFRAK